ncbi:MAG: TadE/TadG family type IV pilus assembly protein [Acidimicrobiales bacterium]
MRRPGCRRGVGMEGAVLVEFALVLPFLALMAFGIVEFGLVRQDQLTVETAGRAAVRVGSAAGNSGDADKSLLLGLGSAITDVGLDNVQWVVVYRSTTADGSVPSGCGGSPPTSVSGSCNVYTGAQLKVIASAAGAPASWFGCGAGSLDGSWCPASRQTTQAFGTDYLGAWVRAVHPLQTGFFGSQVTIDDRAVMRLEPR